MKRKLTLCSLICLFTNGFYYKPYPNRVLWPIHPLFATKKRAEQVPATLLDPGAETIRGEVIDTERENKREALAGVMHQIQRSYGKGSIQRLGRSLEKLDCLVIKFNRWPIKHGG